ncbi:hypothetical protein [Pelagibaculum spongiae]|uniref:DUF3024 domain-containing protein n=1 Tax=Pelagibaculum spongiae TaxID=2080658 RepID=A0A2V1GP79_9GAMM|nr:hypothetical protein [Pelagibaculum spongiae]PVZ64375.1 hypothetical protein DC094_20170 [Pelagibaculum spongiae]
MTDKILIKLSDRITEAHTRIQKDFEQLNPVVGLSRGMRAQGIPADAITIDCLKSKKRIILILHDHQQEIVSYQRSFKDQDPSDKFEQVSYDELTAETLYCWIKDYFLES